MTLVSGVVVNGCATVVPVPAPARPATLAAAVTRSAASAVGIHAKRPAAVRDDREAAATIESSVGAGFLFDGTGRVVTAAHVVEDASEILVVLHDRQIVPAVHVGSDPVMDIALLKIVLPWPHSPVLAAQMTLDPGDIVVAIGDPYGLERSVSAGVVAATSRHFDDDPELLYIQTDLPLHPGDSGAPLIDAAGLIVGMNARLMIGPEVAQGLALAVPIDIVRKVIFELEHGEVPLRRRLGARFEDPLPAEAFGAGRRYARGVRISAVESGGIAARLDLRVGDIVVGMNGQPIDDSAEFLRMLNALDTGSPLRLAVLRDGAYRRLE